MTNSTYGQEINYIELFLEVMSQYTNVFAGIKQQLSLPMTQEEQDLLEKEWLNYCDYNYILAGAYVEGFSRGMGFLERYEPIPQDIWDKGEAVYNNLKQPATHPMTQEERNQFANKWLSRAVFNHTQIGAFKHGHKEGRAEGRAEGIAEGREEGESKAKLTMAQNLKCMGMDNDFIMQVTGLPVQEIEAL